MNNKNWIKSNRCKLNLLDYCLDNEDNFWIVNKISNNLSYGYIVYKVDKNGTRFNPLTQKKYSKCLPEKLYPMPAKENIKCVFKPNEFYKFNKNNLPGIWKKFALALNNIGIKDNNIGVFGSYLVGFDVIKDVDFVVYGSRALKNCYKNIENINAQLGATNISEKYVQYQYEKFKSFYNPKTSLKKIISYNWAGVQVDKILSTIRFILPKKQTIPQIDAGKRKIVGVVLDGVFSACFPRMAKIKVNDEIYDVITPLWKLQSFAVDGEKLEIFASVDDNKKIILIKDKDDYLKILD